MTPMGASSTTRPEYAKPPSSVAAVGGWLRSRSLSNGKLKPQSLAELRTKMTEYVASGLRLGWLINPPDQQVEIYRAGQAVEVVSLPTTLSGEEVLPGFELQLS